MSGRCQRLRGAALAGISQGFSLVCDHGVWGESCPACSRVTRAMCNDFHCVFRPSRSKRWNIFGELSRMISHIVQKTTRRGNMVSGAGRCADAAGAGQRHGSCQPVFWRLSRASDPLGVCVGAASDRPHTSQGFWRATADGPRLSANGGGQWGNHLHLESEAVARGADDRSLTRRGLCYKSG